MAGTERAGLAKEAAAREAAPMVVEAEVKVVKATVISRAVWKAASKVWAVSMGER